MKRRLAGCLSAALLSACGASDDESLGAAPRYGIPGCERFSTAPCGVLERDCQLRLLEIAACLRETKPGELPPVSVMTEADYAAYLAQDQSAPLPPEVEKAFVMLGLVSPGALAPSSMTTELVSKVAGFYREDQQDVVIIDHGPGSDEESASATLVHEFIHVLQDREVGLGAFSAARGPYLDSSLAARALIEGEARWHQLRYAAAMLGVDSRRVDWSKTLQNRVEGTEAWVLEQPSPFVAGQFALPYEWGARYLFFEWQQTGQAAIRARFSEPPVTTHAVMASVAATLDDDFAPSQIALPTPPDGWELLGDEVLGSFGTFFLLERAAGRVRARELALAWRGDHLGIYRAPSDAGSVAAVIWYVDFASNQAAIDAAGFMPSPPAASSSRVSGTRVFVWGSGSQSYVDFGWAAPSQ
jgi:hypothetical protein